jgi:protein-tyrosine-phosphatase
MNTPVFRMLFVCVENSNRSQMAEAFARMHGGPEVEAYSAGSRPTGGDQSQCDRRDARARLRPFPPRFQVTVANPRCRI